ncbi:MAG TPA: glycerol-3-phosphate 1-O-acyltransferase PlsY [Terrimicrobiaceae bacterium]
MRAISATFITSHMLIFAPAVALGAYLLGSIPSGYIVGRIKGVDLRTAGSGNIGATNALRVLGKKWGYFVFAADFLKGWLSVVIAVAAASRFPPEQAIVAGIIAGVFAMVGHIFPVWLGFKGGKGIATAGGILLGLFPVWVFLCAFLVWIVLFYTTRYVSVASIGAAISLPVSSSILMLYGRCDWRLVVIAILMCILAVWRHKSNIERLFAGTEKKFDKKHSTSRA